MQMRKVDATPCLAIDAHREQIFILDGSRSMAPVLAVGTHQPKDHAMHMGRIVLVLLGGNGHKLAAPTMTN